MSNPYDSLFNPYVDLSLRNQIFLESRAMAEYAIAQGIKVPKDAIKYLEEFISEYERVRFLPEALEEKEEKHIKKATPELNIDIERLVDIHDRLAELVKPATPKTILLLDIEGANKGFWSIFGPVPLLRRMMAVAIAAFLLFIGFSLFYISPDSASPTIITEQGIGEKLFNVLYLLASAALGASFFGLVKAGEYVENNTFDPKYEASYWIRFALGLISGIMLATVIPLKGKIMAKPLLAILGGYSSDVVINILNGFVKTLKGGYKQK